MGFMGFKVFKLFVLSVCIPCICGKIAFCYFFIHIRTLFHVEWHLIRSLIFFLCLGAFLRLKQLLIEMINKTRREPAG